MRGSTAATLVRRYAPITAACSLLRYRYGQGFAMITAEQQDGRDISGLGRYRDHCLLGVLAAIKQPIRHGGRAIATLHVRYLAAA